jgi:hypothetical protein
LLSLTSTLTILLAFTITTASGFGALPVPSITVAPVNITTPLPSSLENKTEGLPVLLYLLAKEGPVFIYLKNL